MRFSTCPNYRGNFCCEIALTELYTFCLFNIFVFYFQWRVLTAPFHHVAFADFWLADQLNSLVVAILDMEYLSCFYALDFYSVQGEIKNHWLNFIFVQLIFGSLSHSLG